VIRLVEALPDPVWKAAYVKGIKVSNALIAAHY
jgi:hypothetical protein